MVHRVRCDSGQAAPLYITAVAGLLFLGLVFFAFGKADLNRNGTQSAADAAALAGAQDSRDQFEDELLLNILDPEYLEDIFNGVVPAVDDGCGAAAAFAAVNDAALGPCGGAGGGRWGTTVVVDALQPVGASVIPGTEGMAAKATATAVVEPRCTFEKADEPTEGDPGGEPPPDGEEVPSPGSLLCEGEEVPIDPENLDLLPDMADLFAVRLDEA
ncbi:pilus assembly protein TadG-related protein [Streptomyces sp. NPDC060194]|uniref:pilus assembly protein TadG-related protein n=1 Tax=Streptomyces sp. NPDC060194 TaxID=3347069 RepID=UPI00364CD9D0